MILSKGDKCMKIILSRKGFDSAAGGYPSPILLDGTLLSLPIPDDTTDISYNDLALNEKSYYDIMNELKPGYLRLEKNRLNFNKATTCHLDPDLYYDTYERKEGWKGIFGQIGATQSHLMNQKIEIGDIFLFFGWFRKTLEKDGKLVFDPEESDGKHIIYGYLQIGDIIEINENVELQDWMLHHPHTIKSRRIKKGNTIYIARDRLTWDDQTPGFGTFKYRKDLELTKTGCKRSKWKLPDFFRNAQISYHTQNNWKDGYFKCADRGQEFVIKENNDIMKWAKEIISGVRSEEIKEFLKVPLEDILNVVKADAGKEIVNNFMNNVIKYFKDTYGTLDKAPKDVTKLLFILGETAKNIEKTCDEMIKGRFSSNFDITDIDVVIPKDKFKD